MEEYSKFVVYVVHGLLTCIGLQTLPWDGANSKEDGSVSGGVGCGSLGGVGMGRDGAGIDGGGGWFAGA